MAGALLQSHGALVDLEELRHLQGSGAVCFTGPDKGMGILPSGLMANLGLSSRCDSIPVSTSLLGDTSDTTSTGLAQRLARKTNKQVFVSYNLQNTDSNFALLVENRIKEEMEAFPEKF
uniref:Proteasome assembly chaperone 4 n=1 Tax=Ailuropoda melanoleuca TaxID=9646 RepID=G1M787_AILME